MCALHRTATAVVLCAGLLLTAGCQNNNDPQPLPPAETTSSPTTTPSPSATTTAPAWESKYSPTQIAAYNGALRRFEEYERKSEPIWRAGKATPATEKFFKEYFSTWFVQQDRLNSYERVNAQIHGIPKVVTSRPTRIKSSADGQSVTIRQCADFSGVKGIQNGEPVPPAKDLTRERTLLLSRFTKPRETSWLISNIKIGRGTASC